MRPTVQHEFHYTPLRGASYEDDMSPFPLRLSQYSLVETTFFSLTDRSTSSQNGAQRGRSGYIDAETLRYHGQIYRKIKCSYAAPVPHAPIPYLKEQHHFFPAVHVSFSSSCIFYTYRRELGFQYKAATLVNSPLHLM